MAEICGQSTLHYVSVEDVEHYMGVYHATLPGAADYGKVDVMWYAKSMSSIDRPSPDLVPMLRSVGRLDLLGRRKISVLNWAKLCEQYGVASVDVVQLDCEGKDCSILRGLLAHCKTHPSAYPRVVQFETNHLTEVSEVEKTLESLKSVGYTVRSWNDNNAVVER